MGDHNEGGGVPVETIARLFRDVAFKEKDTSITVSALELASEYISLFVSEAVLRSNQERILEAELEQSRGTESKPEQTQEHTVPQLQTLMMDGMQDLDPEDVFNSQEEFSRNVEPTNDVIDTRHLARVAGILVLDF